MIPDRTALLDREVLVPATAREARRKAIVDIAREAFFDNGYAGTAMSAIAAAAGGSKTTLWTLFPSKQDLFAAVVDDLVERFGAAFAQPIDPETPVKVALHEFGRAMMTVVLRPEIVALNRLVMGEAGRFPELGRLFFERGPKRGKAKLAVYLRHAMADGRLCKGDPERASRQFAHMCQSGFHQTHMLNLTPKIEQDEIDADIDAAVTTFLRAWAPPA